MKSHPSYELVGAVGHGRLATVYRARDLALKREVAIKELTDNASRDERLLQRFWDEARFLANVEHDNVVQIYGLDQERGWVIMELAAGGLDAVLARGPLPAAVVRGVLRQVLEGLECLHGVGHVHGAIKPSNLLVTQQGHVKLSDTTGVSGSPASDLPAKYLAPEQLDPTFGPVGPGVDLYCLGFTALELLTGSGFDALFPDSVARAEDAVLGWRRLHGGRSLALPAAATAVPGLPPDLARVIDRLLQKDVAARYASAAEALKDLDDVPSPPVAGAPSPATISPGPALALAPANTPTVHGASVVASTGGPQVPALETLLPTMFPVLPSPSDRGPSRAPVTPVPTPPSVRGVPALETVRDTVRYPRWSRRWINQKLENPLVLYPVCGTIAFVTVLLLANLFMKTRPAPTPESPVAAPSPPGERIASSPEGAPVAIDGESKKKKVDSPITPPTSAPPPTEKKPPVVMPTTGKLVVASMPASATIYVDGKERGHTPADLDLPPGLHTVRLEHARRKAWQEDVDIQPGKEVRKYATLEWLRGPASFALLVGVRSAGEGLPIFQHAPGDIAELGRILVAGGYPEKNVKVLAQIPTTPTDSLPTAEHVRRAVKALVTDRQPGDTLLLALAGPVIALGGSKSYFCPAGADLANPATLIPLEEILRELAECREMTKVVLIDGNRTGAPLPARPAAAISEELVPEGVIALVSTANGAPGLVHARDRHGAFWEYVHQGLRGAADAGRGGKVTADDLARYLTKEVREHVAKFYKAEQTPILVDRAGQASSATLAVPDVSLKKFREGTDLVAAGDLKDETGDSALAATAYADAAKRFSEAVELRPNLVDAFVQRSVARFKQKKFDDAIADCTEALRIVPTAAAYDYRGDAHSEKENEDQQAIDDYSRAILFDPDYGPVFMSRGAAHSRLKNYPLAVKDYTRAIELAPVANGKLFDMRGRARLNSKEYREAVDDFTQAIKLAPVPDPKVFERRGQAYQNLKSYREAAADFTEAIKLKPRDANLFRQRGAVYQELGEKDRAEDDLRKARELRTNQSKSPPAPAKG